MRETSDDEMFLTVNSAVYGPEFSIRVTELGVMVTERLLPVRGPPCAAAGHGTPGVTPRAVRRATRRPTKGVGNGRRTRTRGSSGEIRSTPSTRRAGRNDGHG